MQALIDQITAHTYKVYPAASPAEVHTATDAAVTAWLDALNRSIGKPALALTREEVVEQTQRYSFEFGFLALEYGRLLTGAPDFAAHVLVRAVTPILASVEGVEDVTGLLALLPWALKQLLQVDVHLVLSSAAATLEWRAGGELETLHPYNHDAYTRLYRDAYPALLRMLPARLGGHVVEAHETPSPSSGDGPEFRWRTVWRQAQPFPVGLLAGGALSALLTLLALTGPGALAWVAWLPAAVGGLFDWALHLRRQRDAMRRLVQRIPTLRLDKTTSTGDGLAELTAVLKDQVENLDLVQDVILALGATLNLDELTTRLLEVLTGELGFDRALLLLVDEARQTLVYGDTSHAANSHELQLRLESIQLPLDTPDAQDDPLLAAWLHGETVLLHDEAEVAAAGRLSWVFGAQGITACLAAPLRVGERLIGVAIVDNSFTGDPIDEADCRLLAMVSNNIAIAIDNARLYGRTDEALEARVAELRMQQQIDRELTATLDLARVMRVTIDWALRFTDATAGSVALYDADSATLRIIDAYGYPELDKLRDQPLPAEAAGIAGRVARTGKAQIVPDVGANPGYLEMAPGTCSQMSVPIILDNQVVGVLSLESTRPAAFGEPQLDFAERLADRAAVAIVNTRLYTEAHHEREKLSTVLNSTADGVIVIGQNGLLELVNPAAYTIFGLGAATEYQGKLLAEVIGEHAAVLEAYIRAIESNGPFFDEVKLSNEKFYRLGVLPVEGVGWVVVLQDITHFKEVDRLKSELLATVSHDLKNPLSVMSGYIELLEMRVEIDEKNRHYIDRIRRSLGHMGDLISDLLEMARIETGISIEPQTTDIAAAIYDVVDALHNHARQKDIGVTVEANAPPALADPQRLRQILLNLVSNALKYTSVGGSVHVTAEACNGDFVTISVIDNGLGIAPENQPNVFSRFYRERRPETRDVEGTGLGLSIAKALVEAQGGTIGFTSTPGAGSAFYFTVPRA
ncbi:MAG: GAF domain-containing protein [Anaerolineae bacterium]|nr:GAF domain-containing protein [Anaerolineae bacterium]